MHTESKNLDFANTFPSCDTESIKSNVHQAVSTTVSVESRLLNAFCLAQRQKGAQEVFYSLFTPHKLGLWTLIKHGWSQVKPEEQVPQWKPEEKRENALHLPP